MRCAMARLTARSVQEFGLPEGQSLNLPVCACILLKGKDAEGADSIRPYTPISDNSSECSNAPAISQR